MQKTNHYRGYFKFTPKVTEEELVAFAQELSQDPRYLALHIRHASKDQLGLGFIYEPTSTTKEESDQYLEDTTDMLRKRFGNGLFGWDISPYYITIK